VSFVDISPSNRRAEVLIGLAEFPYLGMATEAMLLAMEFGFRMMGLHKIYSMLYANNEAARRNTVHLGFRIEGHLREHVADPRTHQRIDVLQLGLLRSDLDKRIDRLSLRLLGRRLVV
jgi:diamine N-acetyltransferase